MGRTRAGNISLNKQPGLLSVRSALVRCRAQVRGGGGEKWGRGEGTSRNRGNWIKGEKLCSTAVFSHSARTGVICALGLLSLETRQYSAMLLIAYLSKPLSIELFNTIHHTEGKLFVIIIRQLFSGQAYLRARCCILASFNNFLWFHAEMISTAFESLHWEARILPCLIKKARQNSSVSRSTHQLLYYSWLQPPDGKLELIAFPGSALCKF